MGQAENKAATAIACDLAAKFIERATTQGMKGRKRDDAALEYWIGAAVLARLQGEAVLADYLERLAAYLLSVRGYAWLVEFAGENRA